MSGSRLSPLVLVICTAAVLVSARCAVAAPAFNLGPRVNYTTGRAPWCVIAGDLNGDGSVDLVTANAEANSVSVLLGRGDGTFMPHVDFATGASPRSAAISDMDLDGRPDLIVANSAASTVSILRGRGDGTFEPRVDHPAGSGARSVAVGDLNGDGRPDLITTSPATNQLTVALALPGGGYGALTGFATGALPWFVVLGDLDLDGRLDAVGCNHTSGSVFAMLGRGDGTFRPRLDYLTAWDQWQVALSDFNRDGKLDFAVVGASDCYTAVQLGRGDGTFSPRSDAWTGCSGYGLAAADLNNDRLPDLVATYDSYYYQYEHLGGVSLNAGLGTGAFAERTGYETGLTTISVTAVDLDGNASPDLAVANAGSSSVSVLLNAIPWGRPTSTTLASSQNPCFIGDLVRFTATVSPDSATGFVDFASDGLFVGRTPVVQGVATLELNSLVVGTHKVVATHGVNVDYGVSASDTLVQKVEPGLPTATLATFLAPVLRDHSIEVHWALEAVPGTPARVERNPRNMGWQEVATLTADGSGRLSYLDPDVTAGVRYGYRLRLTSASGAASVVGEGWVTMPTADSAPRVVSPVLDGDIEVSFLAPRGIRTSIRLFDASGRQIARRESVGEGQRVTLSLARARSLPPGVYLVRLDLQRPVTLRVAVIR